MTRAEKRTRNYRLVRNKFQNVELAKRAREWSDERLYNELGIKTTKTIPKLKEIKASRQSYYDRKLSKYQFARDQGLEPSEANEVLNYKESKIVATAKLKKARRMRASKQKRRNYKYKLWGSFSRKENKNFPPSLRKQAVAINRSEGMDDHDKYGYTVVFFSFVEEKSVEEVKSTIVKPDYQDSSRVVYMTEFQAKE